MSDLVTSENVVILRKAFEDHDGFELTLAEFMNTMNRVVLQQRAMDIGKKVTRAEEVAFAVDMVELFKQIDVNGNGMLEWSEFTSYIVETGRMLESKETQALRKTTEAGFFVGERESRYVEHEEEVTNVEIGHKDENEIIKDGGLVVLGAPFHCLAVVCVASDVIRLYSLPMRPKQIGFKQYRPQTLRHHTQFRAHRALGITYIPNLSVGVEGDNRSYIVTSSIDELHGTGCFISFWARVKRSLKVVCRVNMHNVMDQLCWCSANDTLYSASSSRTATIEAWKLVFGRGKSVNGDLIFVLECHKVAVMQWHSSPVTRLRYIPDNVSPQIASFSKDGTVCFWHTHSNRKSVNHNVHDRGIRGCAVSMKLKIIVTVGFGNICFPNTLCALVWTMINSTTIDLLATLAGHEHPLVDVVLHEFPDDLAHIVTIDERGHLMRWCAHKFIMLQQFTVPERVYGGVGRLLPGRPVELQAIAPLMLEWAVQTHEPPHPGIVVASGTSLGVMESLPVHHAAKPLIYSVFNSVSMTFLTCAARSMRIWDALTGTVLRTYGEHALFPHGDRTTEITCCCLDDRKRKIITGDNRGHISVWNYLNGALMKVLDPHSKDVSSLIYIAGDKLTVSTSWDGKLHVNDEIDNDGYNRAARKSVLMRDVHVLSTVGGQKALFNERSATPSGKHLRVDIAGLQYSDCLGMVAMRSHIGTTLVVNILDLEYMRLLGCIHCPKRVNIPEPETPPPPELLESSELMGAATLNGSDKDQEVKQAAMLLSSSSSSSSSLSSTFGTVVSPPDSPVGSGSPKAIENNKHQKEDSSHNEIMSICFFESFAGLAFSDDSGCIYLCTAPILRRKFKCVGALVRPSLFEDDTSPTVSVLSLCTKLNVKTGGLIIFGGCENGEVVQWDLTESFLSDELGILKAPADGLKQPAYNGRRTLRNGTYRARELLPSRSQRGGLEVDKLPILPTRWWRAHKLGAGIIGRDAVIDVHLIEVPNSLLCVSQNGTANLWDLDMTAIEEAAIIEAKLQEEANASMSRRERIARRKRDLKRKEDQRDASGNDDGGDQTQQQLEDVAIDGNMPCPRMLGILDPDINRATPEWKFELNMKERERNNILEAKRVLVEAQGLRKKPRRMSISSDGEGEKEGESSTSSPLGSRTNSQKGSPVASPISSPRPFCLPVTPLRASNKHDYNGHDTVMGALSTAFERPISPHRKSRVSGLSAREDFSSSNSKVTADMLRGRISSDGGEMMKWRREAEEQKKHGSRFPRVRTSKQQQQQSEHAGLRSRVLSQLISPARSRGMQQQQQQQQHEQQQHEQQQHEKQQQLTNSKRRGWAPVSNPVTGPNQWYEYSGSRSSVPKVRHLNPEHLDYLRNDGWEDMEDAMSDNLSQVADDANDLECFLTKGMDPADVWVDEELGQYAKELESRREKERRDPTNKVTGAPKRAGVTETIHFMREQSRRTSKSRQGRMMRVAGTKKR